MKKKAANQVGEREKYVRIKKHESILHWIQIHIKS